MVARRTALLVLVLVVIGALLRLPLLAERPLWFDEIQTLEIAKGPVLERLALLDRMPPVHALVVHPVLLASDEEWALRLPSFVAGVLSIAAAFAAGRAWSSPRAGVLLAALVAVSPPLVFYAREARPYSLGVLAVFALLAVAPRRSTLLLVLASTASVLTLWSSALVVAFVHLAVARRDRRTLVAAGATALLLAPAALLLRAQLASKGSGGGFLEAAFYRPGEALGFARANLPALASWVVCGEAAGVVALLVALSGAAALGRGRLLLAALGPVVALLVLAGLHVHPFGAIRQCLPLAPGILLLAACGLDALGRRANVAAALVAALLVGAAAHGVPRSREWYYEDVPGTLAEVRAALRPGDKLYVEGQARPHFERATRRAPWPGAVATSRVWLRGPELAREIEAALEGAERVWVLYDLERASSMAGAERLLLQAGLEPRARVVRHYTRATLWARR